MVLNLERILCELVFILGVALVAVRADLTPEVRAPFEHVEAGPVPHLGVVLHHRVMHEVANGGDAGPDFIRRGVDVGAAATLKRSLELPYVALQPPSGVAVPSRWLPALLDSPRQVP